MIDQFEAQDFGCLKHVSVKLSRLHAFIGPNDSGKSTLLRAIELLITRALLPASPTPFSLSPYLTPRSELRAVIGQVLLRVGVEDAVLYACAGSSSDPEFRRKGLAVASVGGKFKAIADHLRGVRLVRLDADALRAPSGLIPGDQPLHFSERGAGLAGVYDGLRDRNEEAFQSVRDQVRALFPTVRSIRPKPASVSTKSIEIELTDGTRVDLDKVSEGLLFYLAFATLPHLSPVSILLVEEPENGLHPARIAEVMRVLREVSKTTQVIIATHSPLVVNELAPDEVTLVTRPSLEEGTQLTPIAQTPNFEQRSKVYALGELWLSYADGKFEEPLLRQPASRP